MSACFTMTDIGMWYNLVGVSSELGLACFIMQNNAFIYTISVLRYLLLQCVSTTYKWRRVVMSASLADVQYLSHTSLSSRINDASLVRNADLSICQFNVLIWPGSYCGVYHRPLWGHYHKLIGSAKSDYTRQTQESLGSSAILVRDIHIVVLHCLVVSSWIYVLIPTNL